MCLWSVLIYFRISETANEVVTPLLGTTRWSIQEGRLPKVYHPESRDYVPLFTKEGAHTIKEIVLAGSRYVVENHKPKIQKAEVIGTIATGLMLGGRIAKKYKSKSY